MDRKELIDLLAKMSSSEEELEDIYEEARKKKDEEQKKKEEEREKEFFVDRARDDLAYSIMEYQLALGYIDEKDYEDEDTYDSMFSNIVEELKSKEKYYSSIERLFKIFS